MVILSGLLRSSRIGDEKGLYQVWRAAFGDTDAYIDGFFSRLYTPGMAAVYEIQDQIVSAAYALPLGKLLIPGSKPQNCAVTYALGTLPEYRSRGIGGKVAKMAADMCTENGVGVLCPAEPSLFGYYEKFGYRPLFSAERCTFQAKPVKNGVLRKETAQSYSRMREMLLSDTVHIAYSEKIMAYQEYLCLDTGGGLFSVNFNGAVCVASAQILPGGQLFLEELLCPEDLKIPVASMVANRLGLTRILAMRPANESAGSTPVAMLLPSGQSPKNGWFGFSFG